MTGRGAWTVATYPHDLVRLACGRCERQGQYRRAALVQRFGANASVPDVLHRIAQCPRVGNASDPCGVCYPDLAVQAGDR
jgi:hypothetical protein